MTLQDPAAICPEPKDAAKELKLGHSQFNISATQVTYFQID